MLDYNGDGDDGVNTVLFVHCTVLPVQCALLWIARPTVHSGVAGGHSTFLGHRRVYLRPSGISGGTIVRPQNRFPIEF